METTTAFDLTRSIQHWRENLAASPAIRGENLDELETHLRDSVANLQSRNLSDEEAFLIATKRVGSNTVLEKEFGKANSQAVWLDRFFWALILVQAWNAIGSMVTGLGLIIAQGYSDYRHDSIRGWFGFFTQAGMPILSMVFSTMVCLWLIRSPQNRIRKVLENLSNKPLILAIALLVVKLPMEEILPMYYYASIHNSGSLGNFTFWNCTRPVLINFFMAGLVFVLARKRLLRIA